MGLTEILIALGALTFLNTGVLFVIIVKKL